MSGVQSAEREDYDDGKAGVGTPASGSRLRASGLNGVLAEAINSRELLV